MAYAGSPADRVKAHAEQSLERAAHSGAMEWMARIGYAARGAVHVLVGVLAVSAAAGRRRAAGSEGAMEALLDKPFGQVLLAGIAIGLAFYALWRFVQAAADTEHKGAGGKGAALRAGQIGSGLVNLALAFTALSLWRGWGGGDEGNWTATLMAQPFGPWLVGIAGISVVSYGVHQLYRAYRIKLDDQLDFARMGPSMRRAARFLGRAGVAARGVVFTILGVLVIRAALVHEPGRRVGVEDALDALAAQPYGPWLLGIVALGLIAYGLFEFVRARYRRIAGAPA